MGKGLAPGFDKALAAAIEACLKDERLQVPGVVVMAKRGEDTFHQAFGCADLESNTPMTKEAMFRMYSMTKVMTSTIAIMLHDKGLLGLSDPVSKFIPSFDKKWDIVQEVKGDEKGHGSVEYYDHLSGKTETLPYNLIPSQSQMLIKHLMAESSGIGYDLFSDLDTAFGFFGVGKTYAIASGLRRAVHPHVYRSTKILGADLDLEAFCDVISKAGVLVSEPGEFSYGLGATVLGRVIEVAYNKHHNTNKCLEEIFSEMLFQPLGMKDACFFLDDGDSRVSRIPTLYGATVDGPVFDALKATTTRAELSIPQCDPPYSNHTDHYKGPRKYQSGDTGGLMTVEDYSKFLNFLLNGGIAPNGQRLLSVAGAQMVSGGRLQGLKADGGLAKCFGVAGDASSFPQSFNFGWTTTHDEAPIAEYGPTDVKGCCQWSGYGNTHVRFYPKEDAYIIIGVQMMANSLGMSKFGDTVLRIPILQEFLNQWS